MHPAPSVIIFTALSGLGFGLFIWIGLGLPEGLVGTRAFGVYLLAYGLSSAGLIASTFHLGNRKNALYAFTQWQTSWLSREGILSVATLLVFAPMAVAQVFFNGSALGWLGPVGSALALATVFSTSMIYTQLKTVPRWNMPLNPVLFLLYATAGGALLAMQAKTAGVLLLLLVALQWAAWLMGDGAFAATRTSKGSATGLDRIGKVTSFESAHTARNYILDEMVHVVGQKHSRKLRTIATILLGILPVLILLLLPPNMPLAIFAFMCHLGGLFAARWLFFAEAEHVVSTYYGRG